MYTIIDPLNKQINKYVRIKQTAKFIQIISRAITCKSILNHFDQRCITLITKPIQRAPCALFQKKPIISHNHNHPVASNSKKHTFKLSHYMNEIQTIRN